MKISAINFNNFSYKLNKPSYIQTRPMSLGVDTVQFSKNISFKGELKSEDEILEFEKEAQEDSLEALKDVARIKNDVAKELEEVRRIKAQIATMHLPLIPYNELIIGWNTITYRTRETENGPYNEYVFDMDAKIKTISKGVRNTDKMGQEFDERYTFDENQELDLVECYYKKVPVRRVGKGYSADYRGGYVRWNSRYGFSKGQLSTVAYSTTYNVSGRHRAKKCMYFKNDKLSKYMSDYIYGSFGYKYAQGINYGKEDGTFEYKKGFSNTNDGIKYEQSSSFKDGKMCKVEE